jgi:uncharacterized protein DUF998
LRDSAVALIATGVSVGVAALVVLHLLPTGLSPMRAAVSQYGISRYRAGYRVQTIAYGLAGIGAAVGIATMPGPTAVLVVLCSVFAAGRIAIGWFPMDAPGGERTKAGRRHVLLAASAFVAVTAAGVAAVSGVLAVLMVAAFVAIALDRRAGMRHFGLIERCFYVCMTAWLVAVAVMLV